MRKNNGRYHTAYISAQRGHRKKINIITHSSNFYGEHTTDLYENPEKSNYNKKPSRFSVPRWEKDIYLKEKPKAAG